MSTTKTFVSEYFISAVADGYVYQCSCGELYNDIGAAYSCRKCRNYSWFGTCTHVTDVRTDKVVMGTEPSAVEYAMAKVRAEARWAEEKAEQEFHMQMYLQEGPLFDAEIQRQEALACRVAEEAKPDSGVAIDDRMMGY